MTTDDNDDDDHRISYITTFLQSLSITKNSTMVFYHADTIPTSFEGYPIIAHTTLNHTNFILFPTPYLLRDLHSGHLETIMQKYCSSKNSRNNKNKSVVVRNLDQRNHHDDYFRGKYRTQFRLEVANYYGPGDKELKFKIRHQTHRKTFSY